MPGRRCPGIARPRILPRCNSLHRAGLVLPFAEQCFAQLPAEAAGEADEALGVFGEVGLADAGLAVEAVEGGFRRDADEVAVALFVGGENEEMVVVVAFARGAVVLFLEM